MRVLAAILLSPLLLLGAQEPRPLPGYELLLRHTRENLVRAQREQRDFAYKERRTELRMNPFGALGTGPTHVYEVVPLPEGGFLRKLLERDGKSVTDVEVERIEPRNRGRRRDRSGPSAIDDAIAMLEFKIDRRERLNGRDTIVVTFAPKRNARPQTREGRLVRAFTGKVWVDEADREVVKSESVAFDDITYGYGLVARLNKGTTVTLVRERVEPNLWLPTSMRFLGKGRALLVRKLNLDYGVEWFDYRRVAQ